MCVLWQIQTKLNLIKKTDYLNVLSNIYVNKTISRTSKMIDKKF